MTLYPSKTVSSAKVLAVGLSLLIVLPIIGIAAFSNKVVIPVKAGGSPVSGPVLPPVTPPTNPGNNQGNNNSNGSSNNGGSHGGTSAPKPWMCSNLAPAGKADLFQIDRNGAKATLHFTPVQGSVSGYNVIYGFKEGDQRYGGVSMTATNNEGVQSITIDMLSPGKTYSFKVAPVNGCAVGEWSNWLTAKGQKSKFFRYFDSLIKH